jgi:hypothetical protein
MPVRLPPLDRRGITVSNNNVSNINVSKITISNVTGSNDHQQRPGSCRAATTAGRHPTAVPARREVEA